VDLYFTAQPRREGGLEDVTNNDEEQTNVGISHITVYQFAMTLLETLTYENSLSRHEKSHQDELLEAYPALYDLAYICSRHAAVNGYFLAGEKSMPGPADSRAARVIVRKCLGADTLQQYRVTEIRAWKEAKHQLQCVSTAQTFITFSKSSPGNDDPQTRSIISAMLSDIQGFSTRTHFVPAEPHPSDAARIREPRVFFDEEHLGRLIETFDETSREYLLKKAVSARQMIVAAPFPFPIATL